MFAPRPGRGGLHWNDPSSAAPVVPSVMITRRKRETGNSRRVRVSWQITNNFLTRLSSPCAMCCDLPPMTRWASQGCPPICPPPPPRSASRARPQRRQGVQARELPAELVHAGSALDFRLLRQDLVHLDDRLDTPHVCTPPLGCCLSVRPWAEVRWDSKSLLFQAAGAACSALLGADS